MNNKNSEQQKYILKSSQNVRSLLVKDVDLGKALSIIHIFLKQRRFPWPEIVYSQKQQEMWEFIISAPSETLKALQDSLAGHSEIEMRAMALISVTATSERLDSVYVKETLDKYFQNEGIHAQVYDTGLAVTTIAPYSEHQQTLNLIQQILN